MSFQSGRATSVAAFLFLALATCFVCFARTTSAQDADATLDRSTDRLLLLMNGRVIKGRPSDNFDGYVVEKPTGKLLISTDQVRLEATSLQEAYRKQRKTMLVPTAENHFALAQWCLLYKLFHESRQELRDALELKPSYEPARRMLQ